MIDESLYRNISFEENNFAKIADIKSILIWGNKIENPYISFVIPAYSRVKELKTAVESIISQKELFPYEVIIVDDAPDALSDNKKLEYVKTLNDSHVLYYGNTKNLGVEGNWNRCIELAGAEYVSMLHDDDILSPNYMENISKCIKTVEKQKKAFGCIQARFQSFKVESELPKLYEKNRGGLRKYYPVNCIYMGKGPISPPSCGTLFSKKAVIENGGFNSACFPCADYLFGYNLVKKGYSCFVSEDEYGWYRFGINETVKPSVIQDTIKGNYYFLKWLYKQSISNKIFAFFFSKAQISVMVDENNKARKIWCNFDVPEEMDSFIEEYGKHSVGRLIFKISRKIINKITGRCFR